MTNHARTGGILAIISGVFSVFYILGLAGMALLFSFGFSAMSKQPSAKGSAGFTPEMLAIMITVFCVIALLFALLGALAITGGIFAVKHKHWGWALAGAIGSEWLLYPCGVTAVILISLARHEFMLNNSNTDTAGSSADSTASTVAVSEPDKARTAGILTMIAGVMGVVQLGMVFIGMNMMNVLSTSSSMSGKTFTAEYLNLMNNFYLGWGIVSVIFGILAIVGAIMAFQKKHWRWALAGSIAGILTFWPCGIAGTIFMSMAKPELTKPAPTITGV